MFMKKKSSLTPFIWQEIRKMEESGITDILYKRHRISEPNCKPIRSKGNSLGIEKTAPLFILFLFGITFSMVVLLIENHVTGFTYFTNDCQKLLEPTAVAKKELLIQKIEAIINELQNNDNASNKIVFYNKALQLLAECNSMLIKE